MRNETFVLSTDQKIRALAARTVATGLKPGTRVVVAGFKRDGSPRTLTGNLIGIVGRSDESREAISVETEDGQRSLNTWNVNSVKVAGIRRDARGRFVKIG